MAPHAGTSDADGLRYRPLDPARDVSAVCALFETVFQQPLTPAAWHWKYLGGPQAGSFSVVAEEVATASLIGHIGVQALPGTRENRPIRLGQTCDVMLHPRARAGFGPQSTYVRMNDALRALVQARQDAPQYLYGFPGQRPARLGERVGVYAPLQVCTQYTVPPPPPRPGLLPAIWHRLSGMGPLRVRLSAIQPTAAADAVLDALWQRHLQALGAHPQLHAAPRLVKDAAYLRWRYWGHPQQHAAAGGSPLYTVWLLEDARGPAGWLVTRAQPDPVVVDSCLPPGAAWSEAALQALPAPAGAPGARWTCWLPLPGAQARATPIHAVRVLPRPEHDGWPIPVFQPGDTDVF
ncbi:hypothetical protein [Melaminivora sp.]|uniref:hypothetical protein n=1 Tax=Melaminivora sp. TaxID=1933032 RepID=UPI0028AFBA83|nr:hypothetical protein [Melaminivora sp.]